MWVIGNFAEAKHWREAGVCPLKQGNPVGEVALGEDRGEYLSAFSPGGCVILALQEADRRTDHLEKLVVELRIERSDSDFASIPALIGSIEGCTPRQHIFAPIQRNPAYVLHPVKQAQPIGRTQV